MLTVWFRIKTQNNQTMTICVCFERLLAVHLHGTTSLETLGYDPKQL